MTVDTMTDVVDTSSTNLDFRQPAAGFAANRNHPRHLPTPIIPQVANMSFRHHSASNLLEPRPPRTLPSLGQVFGEDNHASNLDVSSPRRNLDFMVKPIQDQNHGRTTTTQISSAKAAEVMQKTVETLRTQIYANGFTDEDIRKAREDDLREAEEADIVNAYARNSTEVAKDQPQGDEADEDYETNPYDDRADKIGLSHHIPGIGHLGHLLTPPGWKAGDEPIPPKHARQLYRETYDAAKKSLSDSIGDFKHLKGTPFQEASDRKNEEWQNRADLAKLILEERTKVYQMHQERKWQQPQPVQERLGRQTPVLQLPSPNAANMQTLPVGMAGPSRYTYDHPTHQNGFLLRDSGAVSRPADSFDRPEPSPKILSPSFLDPSLIPGTIDTVIQRYHTKKAEIQKMQYENELQMKQCLTRYGRLLEPAHSHAQQVQSAPRYLGSNSQPNRRQLPALQRLPYYHPLSNVRNETHEENRDEHNEDRPTTYRYASPPGRNALGIHQDDPDDEPVELALSSPLKQFDEESKTAQLPQTTPQTTNESGSSAEKAAVKKRTPKKKVAASRYAQEKKPVWYASHLENANLPTSTISESAIRAGLAYDPKAPPTAKVTEANLLNTTKKRRRYGDEVPIPEFKMPPEKLRAMFASNLPMKYIGKGPNPYLTENGTAGAGENGDEQPAKRKGKAKVETTTKAPVLKAPSVDVDSPKASDLSDGIIEDEKDATYGGKAKNVTPTKRGNNAAVRRTTPRKAKTARMTMVDERQA
ncbi:MAG: hypothetical protein L6R42_001492 [Xanthoria sp. 1 TBL-2021]|nr:MAG: hypothetical protein L6R42_001492 [Xanthoria sp. 1 TBL-2021]